MIRSNIYKLWKDQLPDGPLHTGVSLHSHTSRSRESMSFIPCYVDKVPYMSKRIHTLEADYIKHYGKPFPQDPLEQLEASIEAVFKSWMQPRAVKYRQVENISGLLGTAVNVQSMVFGNMGDDCGTGVAFTRNPSTGENKFYGEFLVNAQGEDVVAGIRTPLPVAEMPKWNKAIHKALLEIKDLLEKHYSGMLNWRGEKDDKAWRFEPIRVVRETIMLYVKNDGLAMHIEVPWSEEPQMTRLVLTATFTLRRFGFKCAKRTVEREVFIPESEQAVRFIQGQHGVNVFFRERMGLTLSSERKFGEWVTSSTVSVKQTPVLQG